MEKEFEKLKIDDTKTALLIIGMAGTGKTTFINKFAQQLFINQITGKLDPGLIVNLDPAVKYIPYTPQIDIRDKIKIKKLMKTHQLGPNGAIMTALNLYCSEIDKLVENIESKKNISDFVIIDTPGQIEVFTWSASGLIITQAISSTFPTVILYVMDAQRCQDPNSFVSNMLFCCSIFYKMRLPMVIILNKEDVGNKDQIFNWIKDSDSLIDAIKQEDNYLSMLTNQMVDSIKEFYESLKIISVSSLTGSGFEQILPAINEARKEYFEVTLPDLEQSQKERKNEETQKQQENQQKFLKDHKELQKQQQFQINKKEKIIKEQQQKEDQENKQMIEEEVNSEIKIE